MFPRSYLFALQDRAHGTSTFKRMACLAGLAGIAALMACGGGPSSAKLSPTTPPANLNLSASLPAATQGTSYTGSVTASGGSTPYNFSLVSGQLPDGVSLDNSTGNVSGTPNAAGTFPFGVSATDAKGASKQQPFQITVGSAPAASAPAPSNPAPANPPASNPPPSNPAPSSNSDSGKSLGNLQSAHGWGQYGQGPPDFVDCSPSPCDGISFSMTQNTSSPSLSGNATVFWLGGTTPYSDALWNNHLIGQASTQGMDDGNQSLVPSIHDLTYDVDFYGDNLGLSEALEFDINQFFGNMGFIFGHECRIAGGNQWDIWDNSKEHWMATGIPCYPKSGQWNHLTIKVHRTSDNHENYESITLNGQTSNLNWTFDKGSSPGWYGVTVNFQMDGNSRQEGYKVSLDNLKLTYQ